MKISKSLKSSVLAKNRVRPNFKPKTPDTLLNLSLRSRGVSVKIFDKYNNLVKAFSTMISVAKYFGVSSKTISCISNIGIFNNHKLNFEQKILEYEYIIVIKKTY